MPNYVKDPNDKNKQVPGPLTDKHFDRSITPNKCVLNKTPNYVIVKNITGTTDLGFFFGSSSSFANLSFTEGVKYNQGAPQLTEGLPTGSLTGSQHYTSYGAPTAGTQLHIHPTAWSGSAASSVLFIYKGGLDGTGRP